MESTEFMHLKSSQLMSMFRATQEGTWTCRVPLLDPSSPELTSSTLPFQMNRILFSPHTQLTAKCTPDMYILLCQGRVSEGPCYPALPQPAHFHPPTHSILTSFRKPHLPSTPRNLPNPQAGFRAQPLHLSAPCTKVKRRFFITCWVLGT